MPCGTVREGLRRIASRVNLQARLLADAARRAGLRLRHDAFFDTLAIDCADADAMIGKARAAGFNLRRLDGQGVGIALDETVTREELFQLAELLGAPLAGSAGVDTAFARAARGRCCRRRCSASIIPSTRCCATSSGWRTRTSR